VVSREDCFAGILEYMRYTSRLLAAFDLKELLRATASFQVRARRRRRCGRPPY
jgi:hypothetical protein